MGQSDQERGCELITSSELFVFVCSKPTCWVSLNAMPFLGVYRGFGKREHLKTTLHRLKTDPAPAPTLALTPAPGVSVHSGRDEGTEQLRGTVRLLGWTCLYYVLGV